MSKKIHYLFEEKSVASNSVTNNPLGYKYLALLSMLYLSILLCNAILTNRYVGSDHLFVLGGTLTSPFVFLIDNIIAEIYGFKITRSVIFYGVAAQSLFVLICQLILNAPHPDFFINNSTYSDILGWPLLRIHGSGCVAYILAILINARILTHWKVLLKGRKFWLRSLGSCTISEALYSFVAIMLMELQSIPLHNIFKVIVISYSIKMIYNLVFMIPAQWLVHYIRSRTGIDVYDFNKKFTPVQFSYLNAE